MQMAVSWLMSVFVVFGFPPDYTHAIIHTALSWLGGEGGRVGQSILTEKTSLHNSYDNNQMNQITVRLWADLAEHRDVWLVSRRTSVQVHFGSPFSSKVMIYGQSCNFASSQVMKHSNGSHYCPPSCSSHSGGDSVALGLVSSPLPPGISVPASTSPRQFGVKQG